MPPTCLRFYFRGKLREMHVFWNRLRLGCSRSSKVADVGTNETTLQEICCACSLCCICIKLSPWFLPSRIAVLRCTDRQTDRQTKRVHHEIIPQRSQWTDIKLTFAMTKGESLMPPCKRSPYGGPPDRWNASRWLAISAAYSSRVSVGSFSSSDKKLLVEVLCEIRIQSKTFSRRRLTFRTGRRS